MAEVDVSLPRLLQNDMISRTESRQRSASKCIPVQSTLESLTVMAPENRNQRNQNSENLIVCSKDEKIYHITSMQ